VSRGSGVYDLVVAGGGPAGTAAAITAARLGARVLLLERGRFPREKVCGEFLSPEALGLLRSLLLRDCSDARGLLESAPRMRRARVFAGEECLEFLLPAAAVSLSRFELDATLWQAAEAAGVEAHQGVAVLEIQEGDTFHIATSQGAFAAKSVVDASGRWSNLNPAAAARPKGGGWQWLGVKAHFTEEGVADSSDLYFFEGGYCGVQPARDGQINVCAMVRSDRGRSLPEVIALDPRLLERSRGWRQVTETVVTAPLVFRKPRSLRSGVLLAGDSAGFLDPFAGDGISAALHSGALAAEVLAGYWQGRCSLREAAARLPRREDHPLAASHSQGTLRAGGESAARASRGALSGASHAGRRFLNRLRDLYFTTRTSRTLSRARKNFMDAKSWNSLSMLRLLKMRCRRKRCPSCNSSWSSPTMW
jgi:flavin-dependent dehydrogenase